MSNKLPSISIVTPSWNQGAYIGEAIDSVVAQQYPDFEHIIVDNCSSDDTLEILKSFPHLRWVSEPDKGQSDALNKGFRMARGDIVGWLNADDLYLPGAFERIARAFEDDSVDAVYGDCIFVDDRLNFMRNLFSRRPSRWLSLFHCYIPSTTFFFRRNILDQGIWIDEDFHITMDKEFFAHILFSGYNMKYLHEFIAEFRWHAENKSIDTPAVRYTRYREGVEVFNRYSGWRLPRNRLGIELYRALFNFAKLYKGYLKIYNTRRDNYRNYRLSL